MANLDRTRKSYIEIFNEVRRKIGVDEISTLNQDDLGSTMIDYVNDVVTQVSDYGDWQEMYREEEFTANTKEEKKRFTDRESHDRPK